MANAVQQWEAKSAEVLALANQMIDKTAPLVRLYLANGLETVLVETPDGEIVPGGQLTKERVLELVTVFDAFNTWLNTPLAEAGPVPLLTISKVD